MACTAGAQNKTYTVRQGDTISEIAERLQVRRAELVAANALTNSNKLQPGMTLRIPARSIHAAIPPAPKGAAYYTVRNGDNDWTVAHKHGLTLAQLKALNPSINFSSLQIGSRIAVPGAKKSIKAPALTVAAKKPATKVAVRTETAKATKILKSAKPAKVAARTYKVQKNENDWLIARKFDTTVKHLRELNPGVNTDNLQIGAVLKVPGTVVVASKDSSTKVASNKPSRIRTKYAKVNGDNAIIRRGGTTNSELVTMVDRGTQVAVLDYLNGWYKLKFPKGTVGWMRGDLLKPVKTIDVIRENRANDVVVAKHNGGKTTVAKGGSKKPIVGKHTTVASKKYYVQSPTRVASLRPGAPTGGSSRVVNSVLAAAQSRMGSRYVYGSTGRGGTYDCSGYVGAVFAQNGIKLPRTAHEIATVGKSVSRGDLKPGDILFFHTSRGSRISHTAIYAGNGKFMHASSGKGKVVVSSLNEGYYSRAYAGAKRVLNSKSSGSLRLASASSAKKKAPKMDPSKLMAKKEDKEVEAAPAEGPH